MSADRSDVEVLAGVADGDRAALRVLYDRHAPWLALRLARRCADPGVVDETLQDTFLAVWRGAGRYSGQGDADDRGRLPAARRTNGDRGGGSMNTTTITPASAAAAAVGRRRGSVLWALTRFEARRLLTHPLFIAGMAGSVLILATTTDNGRISTLGGYCFTFVGAAIWTCLAAGLAAGRERRDAAHDFYAGQPVAPRVRTEAALLSLGAAGLAGAVLIAVAALLEAGVDGAVVVGGERYALRPLELAQGPVHLVLAGTLGVLVASWTRHAYPAVIVGLVLFFPPVAWGPWFVFGDDVPRSFDMDWLTHASVGWHLTGLAGLTALAAAGALARHDRRPRVALLALAGLAATVAGIALGFPPEPPPGGYGFST